MSSSSGLRAPRSAPPSTSIVTGTARPRGGSGCAPTSRHDRTRRCSSSARRPATAAPVSPGSPSRPSASSRVAAPPRRARRSFTAPWKSSSWTRASCSGTSCRRTQARLRRTGVQPAPRSSRRGPSSKSSPRDGEPSPSDASRSPFWEARTSAIQVAAARRISGPGCYDSPPADGRSAAFMPKTWNAKPGEVERRWYLVDAEGKTLGRLATQIADTLRGKHKAEYTPHVDTGDFVVVVNAEKIAVTGKKLDDKMYHRHSGYPGGLRSRPLRDELARRPTEVLRKAVKGMLPRNRLARAQIKKLKIYAGPEHPHEAQAPSELELRS